MRELVDLLAELAVAELHRRARRRRAAPVRLGLGDAHLGHAPERLDAGLEPADLRGAAPASSHAVPPPSGERCASATSCRSCERIVMMCCANAVPRSKRSVTLVTRQPSFSVADAVGDRHAHLVEEHLAEVALAVDGPHRPDLDARLVHVEDQPGDALVLRRVGVGAHEQLAVVGDVGPGAPDLLAVDDVLVAVAHGPGAQRGEVGARPRARRSPGTRRPRPGGSAGRWNAPLLVGALGDERRAGVHHADEVHADVRRVGAGVLLEVDELLGDRAGPRPPNSAGQCEPGVAGVVAACAATPVS